MALAHTERLLQSSPALAVEQAGEILKSVPNHPVATLLLGVAQRLNGDLVASAATLTALVDAQHVWAKAHYELGITLGEHDQPALALAALRRAAELKPDLPDVWRALADMLTISGDASGADTAFARHIKASTLDPRLLAPAAALLENQIPQAETLLRAHLQQFPTDVAAIRMLAEVAARLGRTEDAEDLLAHCLQLAPGFRAARHHYAVLLNRRNKPAAALQNLEQLLEVDPRNPAFRNLKAVVLARIGEYHESIAIYEDLLKTSPGQPRIWMSYGHALSTAGRLSDSIGAYRRSIQLAPTLGEAYWSLANLKTFRFGDDEVAAMRALLLRTELRDDDRYHLHFAFGKAQEDLGNYAEAFQHYQLGNDQRRAGTPYFPKQTTALVSRSVQLFTAPFFAARANWGSPAPDPIFVVGLPRAGSTLVEQILASHSKVEGTMELPDIVNMARSLGALQQEAATVRYPQVLAELTADQLKALGEQYLEQTRIHRHSDKPYFIDKLPNNFLHIGLIHLILPNARIVDARRHPMACCFSGFKQHFAMGQNFSYRLEDIGRYYRDYVEFMAHFDTVLPGRVHRVFYEAMIDDTEAQVRSLLAYCGLPFEDSCLRFYENDRAVRTASAQQVRQPIFRDGVGHWHHFEPWLGPLKESLGAVLAAYPEVPKF